MIFAVLKKSRIVHLCFAISFFTSGLLINIAQFILYTCLKPFNKRLYRKLGYYMCYTFYSQVVFLADWWSKSKLTLHISKKDLEQCGKEHCLLVMNHTYETDWLLGWMFTEKMGVLGNCKAYAKRSIQYIPSLGWSWKFAEFVFLERSYDKDKEIIGRQISEIMDYPDPTWLLLNAEGTRFTPSKHAASQKFAVEHNLPILKHHLTPRTKGFIASLPALKAKCPAIYDIQLVVKPDEKVSPTVLNLLLGRTINAHMHVRRIPMSTVPSDEEGAAAFMHNLFKEKDDQVDSFLTTGRFLPESESKDYLEPYKLKPSLAPLMNTICWAIITLTPILYYLAKLLLSGELLYFSAGMAIIGTFYILMHKTIGMSKISKGSDYGSNSPSKQSQ
uniref:Putative lysophosphatidic acid acyltransferase lpaat n=1 Tax=Xenopsylla cheopis TaxID=163159 RepID=A0A6M2DW30_XENCH